MSGALSRRAVLRGAAAGGAGLAAAGTAGGRPADAMPNILWLVSEDNNPLIGAYGDTLAHTPHIDRLAREGLLYRNVYSTAPVCAPSRFGILTGVLPESCAPANHMRAVAHLPSELRTYPEYMRSAGYYCTNNAKTDYNCDVDPKRIWDEQGPKAHWKNRPAGKPFMAVFNTMTTHESRLFGTTPGRVTPDQIRLPAYVPDTPAVRQDYASYYNLMERMDGEVGRWVAELEAAGLADDTIIFYYSDNGGSTPRTKRYCYDEGMRCAMVVRIPPKWAHLAPARAGSRIDAPVTFLDLAPTLLSIADLPAPTTMQGSAFLGHRMKAPKPLAFGMRNRMDERYDFVRTVTDGRYRYIRNYMPYRPWGQNQAFEWLQASYQDWDALNRAGKLDPVQARFFGTKPYEEFYDLTADPDQVRNLIDDPGQRVRVGAMRRALDAHMLRINDNGFIPEGSPLEGYAQSRAKGAYPLKRIMALAQMACRRDVRKLAALRRALTDPNEVVRYWGASGLLMLGEQGRVAASDLSALMVRDPSPQVRIVTAEAAVRLGDDAGLDVLTGLMAVGQPMPLRLQAVNALTFLGRKAARARPALQVVAQDRELFLKNAGQFALQELDSTYDPHKPIFDLVAFRAAMRGGD